MPETMHANTSTYESDKIKTALNNSTNTFSKDNIDRDASNYASVT